MDDRVPVCGGDTYECHDPCGRGIRCVRGGIGGPGGIESVNGGLLNGEEITLAGFELVEDLRSSSPILLLVVSPDI